MLNKYSNLFIPVFMIGTTLTYILMSGLGVESWVSALGALTFLVLSTIILAERD